jgi:hypothetical protein
MEHDQMFTKELTQAGRTVRFSITEEDRGWEVREEEDSRVIRRVRYDDWHRVERALLTMSARVIELEEGGWRPVG